MNAVIYSRVSTQEQGNNNSLPSQVAACEKYAAAQGLTVFGYYEDMESGATLERTSLEKIRDLVRSKQINAIVVYCLDRLSRNVAHMLLLKDEFTRYGVALHTVTRGEGQDTPEDRLFSTIEASFAEYERLKIKERMTRGRKAKMNEGKIVGVGPVSFGYSKVGEKKTITWAINEAEAMIVRRIFNEYNAGVSVLNIVRALTNNQIPTSTESRNHGMKRRGAGEWSSNTLYGILRCETYAGRFYQNRYQTTGKHTNERPREEWVCTSVPAIIDEATWQQTQARLTVGRTQSPRNAKRFYLLGGKRLMCECGYTMTGGSRGHYTCSGRDPRTICACKLPVILQSAIENAVWAWVCDALTPERITFGVNEHNTATEHARQNVDRDMATLEEAKRKLEHTRGKALQAFAVDAISIDELKASKEAYETSMKALSAELQRLDTLSRETPIIDVATLMEYAASIRAEMGECSPEGKQKLLDALHIHVTRITLDGEQALKIEGLLGSGNIVLGSSKYFKRCAPTPNNAQAARRIVRRL